MQERIRWVDRLFRGSSERRDVLALLTPEATRSQPVVVRVAVAGVTAMVLAAAGVVAALSMLSLMAAIGIVYFLSTQVLGLKIQVDPGALFQQMQRQAATNAAGFGPN